MKLDSKEFKKRLKLYFSSIFSRTMTNVVFGVPDYKDNQFLFSNIDLDSAELYTPDPNYFVHKVTIKDDDFLHDFYELFPLFKNAIVLLYADKFFTAINKHTEDLCKISISSTLNHVNLNIIDGDKRLMTVLCGEIISGYQATRYKDIFESGIEHDTAPTGVSVENRLSVDTPFTIVNADALFGNDHNYSFVVPTNRATVAIKELLKTLNLTEGYTHNARCYRVRDTIRVNMFFDCPNLDVLSVQPAVVWFPKLSN